MRFRPTTRALLAAAFFPLLCGALSEVHAQTPSTLNYANARLADVIRSLAAALGVNVVLSDVPDKRITLSTVVPVRSDELPGVLESILEANNLILVQKGAIAQVMPADSAPPTGVVRFGTEVSTPPPLGLVTQLVPLQSMRADEAAAAIKQIASPRARVEAVARSNSLLITDMSSNVTRYLELVRRLDERPQGENGMRTYVVPLKYANAEDLANSIGQLFGITVGGSRPESLYDRSLSRSLDYFREREAETFRVRPDVLMVPVPGDTTRQAGQLVGRTTVVPDPPTNSLMIRTAPPNFPLLQETIQSLDTRPPQVLFEVTVAEIALGRADEFGIDWSVFGSRVSVNSGAPPDTAGQSEAFTIRLISVDRANVRVVLRALASKSHVKVLSTPEILAVNNREARIVVGSRVPFVSSARLGDVSIDRAVQYEDVGTTLTIIPTINQDNYVSVQILQEVNTLTEQLVAAAFNAPVISTREASTRAIIRDGQTVVIGGLIGETLDYFDSGVPYLKEIPLIGYLFKKKSERRTRSELAIFVTPYIVRSDQDADSIRERIRSRLNDTIPPIRR
jgi:general secretion pathway protein D